MRDVVVSNTELFQETIWIEKSIDYVREAIIAKIVSGKIEEIEMDASLLVHPSHDDTCETLATVSSFNSVLTQI